MGEKIVWRRQGGVSIVQAEARRNDDVEELHRLRTAIGSSGDVVYTWDLASDQIVWLGATDRLFGSAGAGAPPTAEALSGRIHPEDLPGRMQALSAHLADGTPHDCEYRVRSSTGAFHWVHDRGAAVVSSAGTPVSFCGTLRVVERRKQQQAQLEYLANYDELTGQFNKARLREALDTALAHCLRYQVSGAFIALGLDQLDRINAGYGHQVGDRILIEVAQRLDSGLRETDVIGRLDSDRFGAILTSCTQDEAMAIGERLLQSLRQNPIDVAGARISITASAGVIYFPEQSKTSFDVIAKAEGALHQAKSLGRDCLSVYMLSESQRQSWRESMELGETVTRALKDGRLCFAYQPIVDAASHDVAFYECLLRMKTADGAVVPAADFVPVVEQLGMMRTIDRRALDMALSDLESHPDVTLAVNISGVTAADRGWCRALVTKLRERPDIARRLIVEITETAALHDIEDTARFVSILRNLGCRVAIDDFGAGYTTFQHLRALTVDIVKIDGSFVRGLTEGSENLLFIRNLLSLARAFNVTTIGECVEDAQVAALLAHEGADLMQGFYFGRPELKPLWRLGAAVQPHLSAATA